MSEIHGADGEILADFENGKVVARFYNPETGLMAVELHVDPDVARNLALELTKASIAVEEHELPHP